MLKQIARLVGYMESNVLLELATYYNGEIGTF